MKLNPFTNLIETKKYPFARLIRSSFKDRLEDTYRVFTGGFGAEMRMGLLDYVLFPIALMDYILDKLDKNEYEKASNVFLAVIIVPLILLLAVRELASAIISVVLSPIVALVHLATYRERSRLLEQANKAMYWPTVYAPNEPIKGVIVDRKTGFSLEYNSKERKYDLVLKNHDGVSRNYFGTLNIRKENKQIITALLKLNMFKVTSNLERSGEMENLEENMIKFCAN